MTTWAPTPNPWLTPNNANNTISVLSGNFNRFSGNPDYYLTVPWLKDVMLRLVEAKNEINAKKWEKVVPTWFLRRAAMNSANTKVDKSIKELEAEILNLNTSIKGFLEAELGRNIWADTPENLTTKLDWIIQTKWSIEANIATKKAEKDLYDSKIDDIKALNQNRAAKLKEHTDLSNRQTSLPIEISQKRTDIGRIQNDIAILTNELGIASPTSSRAISDQLTQKEKDLKTNEDDLLMMEGELSGIQTKKDNIMTNIWNQIEAIIWKPWIPADLANYQKDMEDKSNALQQQIAPWKANLNNQELQKEEIDRQFQIHQTNNPNIVAIRSALVAINADVNTMTPVVTGKKSFGQRITNLRKS